MCGQILFPNKSFNFTFEMYEDITKNAFFKYQTKFDYSVLDSVD